MSERDDCTTFMRAIIAAPQDDLPRLIFADALDEISDPLGEFIRLQIELADGCSPGACICTRMCDTLRYRERELFDAHAIQWAACVGEILGTADGVEFCRGFVERITCTSAEWVMYADAFTAATPLRGVTLTTRPRIAVDSAYSRLRFASRRWWTVDELWRTTDYGAPFENAFTRLLAAEWPGIAFTLPAYDAGVT